jgi:two-component system nitrate/nitrite response regulator NarL
VGTLDLKIVAAAATPRNQPARSSSWQEGMPLSVVVLSDVRVFREALAVALRRSELVHEARHGSTSAAGKLDAVDVAIVDLSSPEGLAAARRAAQATRVVAIAIGETDAQVIAAAEAGVIAFVPRDGTLDDVVAGLVAAMRDETFCSPKIAAALLRRVNSLAEPAQRPRVEGRLTAREREILELIDDGCSNKEIAARLTIELPTVKNHVHNILEKLQVSRRSEAAARVRRQRTRV